MTGHRGAAALTKLGPGGEFLSDIMPEKNLFLNCFFFLFPKPPSHSSFLSLLYSTPPFYNLQAYVTWALLLSAELLELLFGVKLLMQTDEIGNKQTGWVYIQVYLRDHLYVSLKRCIKTRVVYGHPSCFILLLPLSYSTLHSHSNILLTQKHLFHQDYTIKKAAKRKQFEAWLASQPFDDEAGKA